MPPLRVFADVILTVCVPRCEMVLTPIFCVYYNNCQYTVEFARRRPADCISGDLKGLYGTYIPTGPDRHAAVSRVWPGVWPARQGAVMWLVDTVKIYKDDFVV